MSYFNALTYWMVGLGAAVWLLTMAVGVYAAKSGPLAEQSGRRLILGLGLGLPTAAVALLLYFGLRPTLAAPATPPTVIAEVTGYMWWWRVRYIDRSGTVAETANELRLPRGEAVELRLTSADVIHSLWIPALARKLDLIPGTTNTLILEAAADGQFEGACAEFCGTAHAQMRFDVQVVAPPEFDRWLERLRAPARKPVERAAARGATLFRDNGCGACHTIQGTSADGRVGPVLTHVGSRSMLGAGVLAMNAGNAALWVGATERLKPGVHMPAYAMLSDEDLAAIGVFLAGLR
jgi:cytochrome c oxidase subunit II